MTDPPTSRRVATGGRVAEWPAVARMDAPPSPAEGGASRSRVTRSTAQRPKANSLLFCVPNPKLL